MQEKIKHFEDQLTSQPSSSKTQVAHQAQETLSIDFLVTTQPVQNIDTVPEHQTITTQTDQDEAILASLDKISKLERELS